MGDKTKLLGLAKRFARDCTGATAVEYGILLLIAVGLVLVIRTVADNITAIYQTISASLG